MAADVIAIDRLRFQWPGQTQACLDIAAFHVAAGERVFLHGESGSGKSTLLALLGGVLCPDQGSLRILGQDLAALTPAARDRFRVEHMGFVFQQFNLIPYLSALDNVLLPCRFSTRRAARARADSDSPRHTAERLLAHLDLAPALWTQPAAQLSVGQQQRVAAARALIGRPELVLADEPTSALDAARQAAFIDLLAQECSAAAATLVFVSHDLRLSGQFTRSVELTALGRAADAA
jgi:putative ABC transport system ATP-binding protein